MLRRFMAVRHLLALVVPLVLCGGCRPSAADRSPPPPPGTNVALTYPVILIGQGSLDVRDSEARLISFSLASGLNPLERVVLDSDGRLFEITSATPEAGSESPWLSMGNKPRRHAVQLREKSKPSWSQVQSLLLQQVRHPQSLWAGDARAVAKVQSLRSVSEAIAACRESYQWAR